MADSSLTGAAGVPGIPPVEIPLPDHLLADDGNWILEPDQIEALGEALDQMRGARLHLGALVELLRRCQPKHLIEAHLYLGNLEPMLEQLRTAVELMDKVVEGAI